MLQSNVQSFTDHSAVILLFCSHTEAASFKRSSWYTLQVLLTEEGALPGPLAFGLFPACPIEQSWPVPFFSIVIEWPQRGKWLDCMRVWSAYWSRHFVEMRGRGGINSG